jgi:hypothetical protein
VKQIVNLVRRQAQLAALYAQRWEFESTLDEIKTHLGGRQLVLRSQRPDGAEQ